MFLLLQIAALLSGSLLIPVFALLGFASCEEVIGYWYETVEPAVAALAKSFIIPNLSSNIPIFTSHLISGKLHIYIDFV